jgi:hypothetical protein
VGSILDKLENLCSYADYTLADESALALASAETFVRTVESTVKENRFKQEDDARSPSDG